VTFRNDREKLAAMRRGAVRDAARLPIVELATLLTRSYAPDDYAGRVQEIHRFVRDGVRYQHDPNGREKLSDAVSTLSQGTDDCDGKARTAAALAKAIGIEADIAPVWKGPILAHVRTAYRWPGSKSFPGARPNGWVVGELTIKDVELGESPWLTPRNPATGKLPLS
jgi:transglutaminase-like putative cysteine protease